MRKERYSMFKKIFKWFTQKTQRKHYKSDYEKDIAEALRNEKINTSFCLVGVDGMSRNSKEIRQSPEFKSLFKYTKQRKNK